MNLQNPNATPVIEKAFRAYNIVFGIFQAPYYAFSQTMMAELTPPGFDNMVRHFLSFVIKRLFNIVCAPSSSVFSGCQIVRRQ